MDSKARPGRRSVLARLKVASARDVAAGGERGWWRWLVPALVVLVVAAGAFHLKQLSQRAEGASSSASAAESLETAVGHVRELRIGDARGHERGAEEIRRAMATLTATDPSDSELQALADESIGVQRSAVDLAHMRSGYHRRQAKDRLDARLSEVAGAAAVTADRYSAEARSLESQTKERSALMLLGGLILAALLMWTFWSKHSAAEMKRRERRFQALLQNSSDLVVVLDGKGDVRYATPVVERMLGCPAESVLGQSLLDLVHPNDRDAVHLTIERSRESGEGQETGHWRARHAEGDWVDVDAVCLDLNEDPTVRGLVVTIRDVGERRSLENQLRHQAFHDPLTGLPNRALFEDRVRHAMARSLRSGGRPAVLFVDLDDFKDVNDSLGHAAGDDLLRQAAERLDACSRSADTAARLGGDEFAILVEMAEDADEATSVATRIHEAVERPFEVQGHEIFVHASVGIAMADQGADADELMRNADIAMYAAKSIGKGRTELYRPTMHLEARKRLKLSGDLRRALRKGELGVQYQPLVSLADGRVLGVEALARWHHPEHGTIPPADFIPLAEETGLIVPIGRFVLGEACRQAQAWSDANPDQPPVYVSVNLSARQFREPGLIIKHVKEATSEAGLDPTRLMLEITESVIMENRDAVVRELLALQELGARIAIDDFGTGYSALSYLRDFPVDTVKMDRSFVHDLARGAGDAALVRSVVELGEALDMEIVAEGIEHRHQLDSLSDLRCGIGQGYYFAKPLDADDISKFLGSQSESPA